MVMGAPIHAQETLTVTEFEHRLGAGSIQLLDVRTAAEFQSAHLKNALQADWNNKAQFADRIQYLDKTKPVLVYCASGVRSAAAAKWMLDNGFTSVQNMKGGLTAWKLEGKPVIAVSPVAQMKLQEYAQLVNSSKIVLVDFGASWCPPCKQMEPVLNQLVKDLAGKFTLQKIDADIATDVMKANGVESIPAFVIYKNGKEVWRKNGVVSMEELKASLLK